jgi:ferredoxin
MDLTDALRANAAAVLRDGRARLVIGYRAGEDRPASPHPGWATPRQSRAPAFVSDPARVDVLVYDASCRQNLAAYLKKPEVRARAPVAVVAPPAVMRSLVLLAAESQVTDALVVLLAVGEGVYHGVLDIAQTAALLREKYADLAPAADLVRRIEELSRMTAEERAAFWSAEFARCTRCYACRAACPMCYCTRCIVEKNVPQWISTAAAAHGNYAWNVVRAFHLAGRCTLCGACEAACPQDIPLMLLNATAAEEVAREFGVHPGYDPAEKPLIGSFEADDKCDFIK